MELEGRIGMGCMRLATDEDADEARAAQVVDAALAAGVTLLDTAGAYGPSEAWLAPVAQRAGALIVTKGGMRRPRGAWVPDGRRKSLIADAERSCARLGVDALDLFLVHAPDPRTPWRTTARALAAIRERGLARHVGLSNVTVAQLDEARAHVEVSAVEVALGPREEDAARGGVIERCLTLSIPVLVSRPLGGPERAPRLARVPALATLAAARGVSPGTLALAWIRDLHPLIVPLPGARRPETAAAAAAAATIRLTREERECLDALWPVGRLVRTPRRSRRPSGGSRARPEVVLLMGVQGAGKSTRARALEAEGYERLNRDEAGGTLARLADRMAARLADGATRIVMDNTYPTRAQRNRVIEAAWAAGATVRCVWIDPPLGQAQIQAVDRMLAAHGRLLDPEELQRLGRRDPHAFGPRVQFRFRDALEPPDEDEGFEAIERVTPELAPRPGHDRPGWVVDRARLEAAPDLLDARRPGEAILLLAWAPGDRGEARASLARWLGPDVELGLCPHPAGPPSCWCQRPLPGLVVAWMRARRVDPAQTRYHGAGPADRALAERLGVTYDGG